MDKLEFSKLFDLYGGMFTQTRREICEMFLNLDLTVSEIAEEKSISRQGVSDALKKCKEELLEFEEKLKLSERLELRSLEEKAKLQDIRIFLENLKKERDADISPILAIIDKDYTEEVEKYYKNLNKK